MKTLADLFKISSHQSDRRELFVATAFTHTDCSPDATKDTSNQKPRNLLSKTRRGDVVILTRAMSVRVDQLLSNEVHQDHLDYNSRRFKTGKSYWSCGSTTCRFSLARTSGTSTIGTPLRFNPLRISDRSRMVTSYLATISKAVYKISSCAGAPHSISPTH